MEKILISWPQFCGHSLPSSRRGFHTFPHHRVATRVKLSLHEIPSIHSLHSTFDFNSVFTRDESLLYALADAAVAVDPAASKPQLPALLYRRMLDGSDLSPRAWKSF